MSFENWNKFVRETLSTLEENKASRNAECNSKRSALNIMQVNSVEHTSASDTKGVQK